MIEEALQETACFYVLGLLDEAEIRGFELEMERSSELREFVAATNNATLALARSAPAQAVSPEAKGRLLASLQQLAVPVAEFPKRSRLAFVPWALAACLALILGTQYSARQKEQLASQAAAAAAAQQSAAVRMELEAQLGTAQVERTEQEARLTSSQAERTQLLAQLDALAQKDTLAQAQIAVLGSLLKDRPQAVAVSVWDGTGQSGQLLVENLPVLNAGRDYQLWIIDPELTAPVSAGVFKVDAQGKVRISFKPTQTVKTVAKFAVTEEQEGGVAAPTMDKMVVIVGA